jgi:protein-tyrosine-phosphatase
VKAGELESMKRIYRKKVMFVCLGNACRSPMAEAIARRIGDGVFEASSAGLTPLGHVEEMTKQTLLKNGYAAEGLTSKPIEKWELDSADLVVNMSGRTWDVVFDGLAAVEHWQVEDPYGADAEIYQRIFEDIEKKVAKLADRLRDAG